MLKVSQKTRRANPTLTTIRTAEHVTREHYLSLLQKNPVEIMSSSDQTYFWIDNSFYEADSSLTFEQAVALARESVLKKARKLQRAVEVTQTRELGTRLPREGISDVVKHHIWIRDKGRCVNCESPTELQYDHVIPLAMGGSNEPGNLQLLCAACNRRKGANLTVDPLPSHLIGSSYRVPRGPSAQPIPLTGHSYISGPRYLLASGSPSDQGIPDNVTRVHEHGRSEALRLISESRMFAESFSSDLQHIQLLIDDATKVLSAYVTSAGTDAESSELQSSKRSLSKAARKKDAQFSKLKKRIDKSSADVKGITGPASNVLAALIPQVSALTEKMNSAPDPIWNTGKQRAVFWVSYLNEIDSLKREMKRSLGYEKFLAPKRRFEEDVEAVKIFFEPGTTSHSSRGASLEQEVQGTPKISSSPPSVVSPELNSHSTRPSSLKSTQIFEVRCIQCKRIVFWNTATMIAVHKGTGLSSCVKHAAKLGLAHNPSLSDRDFAMGPTRQDASSFPRSIEERLESAQDVLDKLLERNVDELFAVTELARPAIHERDEVTRVFGSRISDVQDELRGEPERSVDLTTLSKMVSSFEQSLYTSKTAAEEFLATCASKYERPEQYWEYKFLVREIQFRMDVLRPGIDVFLADVREEFGEEISNAMSYFPNWTEQFAQILRKAEAMHISERLNEALGPPGKSGSEELIRSFARDLIAILHQLLTFGRTVRGTRLRSDFRIAQDLMANLVQGPIQNFVSTCDALCDALLTGIAERENGGAQKIVVRLQLNFDVSKADLQAIQEVLFRLR